MLFHHVLQRLSGLGIALSTSASSTAHATLHEPHKHHSVHYTPSQHRMHQLREAQGVQVLPVATGTTVRLQVMQGLLWLTQVGQAEDRVMQAGQSLHISGPADLMLGALGAPLCVLKVQSCDLGLDAAQPPV